MSRQDPASANYNGDPYLKLDNPEAFNYVSTIGAFKLSPDAKLPSKAYVGVFADAAFDLFSCEDCFIDSNQRTVSTGIALIIPRGYWVKFQEKSGKALKGLEIHGGIIDQAYTGELKVICSSKRGFKLSAGEAVCQFTLEKLNHASVAELTEEEFKASCTLRTRGSNGFGSTGR